MERCVAQDPIPCRDPSPDFIGWENFLWVHDSVLIRNAWKLIYCVFSFNIENDVIQFELLIVNVFQS